MPALVAVALLLALTVSAFFVVQRGPARHAARSADPPANPSPKVAGLPVAFVPAVPAASALPPPPGVRLPAKTAAKKPLKAPLKAAPLSVLLTSSSQGRHVRVGEDVTLTALAHGRCATLTLSYRHGFGGKTTHSFTEGGLLSTTWTPAVPGRYGFTAIALGSRQSAVSRLVEITVDGAAPRRMAWVGSARMLPAEVVTPLPPLPVHLPPLSRPRWVRPPRTVASEAAAPEKVVPDAVAPRAETAAPRPGPATIYHVAAAQFPFSRNAVVLAKSFRLRGSPATTKRMIGYHGKTVYAVVTGAYRHPEEARAAALALQRGGYPAYFFGG